MELLAKYINNHDKKILLDIDDSNRYTITYKSIPFDKKFITLMDAVTKTNFFKDSQNVQMGLCRIAYHGYEIELPLYSNFLSYYGIIKDNDTGWLIIWGVATSNGNIETYGGNSLSIYDDKLKFVRYVELTNVKDVMFMDKLFPIEIIYDINLLTLSDGNFIVCEVGFNKEWLAKFKYDITSGLFGEIVSISRL